MYKQMKSIKDKKITVIGAGISGKGASQLACYLGAKVLLTDIKKKIDNKEEYLNNVKISLGTYPEEAFQSELIIVSPGINCQKNEFIKKLAKKNIPIISEIEFASWFTKSKLFAITGSNGKSTVVKILGNIIKKKYPNAMIGGNIGIPFSQNVLSELKNKLDNVIHILEISSYQLEKTYSFKPQTACILNISKDHLDRYDNYESYYKTKFKIYNNNKLFYNIEDKILKQKFLGLSNTIPFSIKNDNSFLIENNKIINKSNNNFFEISKIKLIGKHNIENILAVLHMLSEIKIEHKTIEQTIYNFQSLNHRMEKIKDLPLIINDSKSTNMHSCKAAIDSFKGDITLILGGYTNETINEDEIIKIINKNNIKNIICYGQIGPKLHKIINKYKNSKYLENLKEATQEAIFNISENMTLLFSPGFKSFDQFNNFEERGDAFKEYISIYLKK